MAMPRSVRATHHGAGAKLAVGANRPGLRGQFRVAGIEQVRQQVQAVAVEPAGQLHARHQRQGVRPGLAGLRVPGDGVVIGERHRVQAGQRRAAHDLSRGIGPVGGIAVHVQVGSHHISSRPC